MLSAKDKETICVAYAECSDEAERLETIESFAWIFEVPQYEVRQVLQNGKVFVKKEGKTEKEQYAKALYAVTLIPEKEWMKMTLKSMKTMMDIFKRSNKEDEIL